MLGGFGMLNGWWIVFYIPVLLAFYVVATHYKQIDKLWIVFLALSLFTGGGPLVALLFLAVNKKMVQGETQPADAPASAPPAQPPQQSHKSVYPEATKGVLAATPEPTPVPPQNTTSNLRVTPQRAIGIALGGIISVVLWVSGLIAVGFFVIVTIVIIQCANDPKCM